MSNIPPIVPFSLRPDIRVAAAATMQGANVTVAMQCACGAVVMIWSIAATPQCQCGRSFIISQVQFDRSNDEGIQVRVGIAQPAIVKP